MRQQIHTFIRMCSLVIMVACVVFETPLASADAAQRAVYQSQVFYFNAAKDQCSNAGSSTPGSNGTPNDQAPTIWNSGLQPPYILEQFAIETLKDIASKRGVDSKNAVTQEHAIALVAFMIGEGGDIDNHDLFNPLNTGLNAPDLLATGNDASGLQSFKSFDAGVEATARTMTGSNQTRLADSLTQQGSTAEQFMNALTYYNQFPGNAFWAAASLPPNTQSYYNGRLALVQRVRSNYANLASIELGTPALEEPAGLKDPSKLQFHPTTDTGGVTQGNETGTSAFNGGAACQDTGNGQVGAGCATAAGAVVLQVPPGGTGTNTCYFNQSDLSGGSYNWTACGCLPTSSLIIQSTMTGDASVSNTDVLNGVKDAGGVAADGCSGVVQGALNYFQGMGYTTNTILAEHGQTTDAILSQVKSVLGQGYLVLAHTSTSIDSAGASPTSGHFLVVYAVDGTGNFYVANPGARADSNKAVTPTRVQAWLDGFWAIKK